MQTKELIVARGPTLTAFLDTRPGAVTIFGTHPNTQRGPYETSEQYRERIQQAPRNQAPPPPAAKGKSRRKSRPPARKPAA